MDKQLIIEKLIRDIQLRGLSKGTEDEYCKMVKHFQEFFGKPATELWEPEIREYLYYLSNDKKHSVSTVNSCNCALRFLLTTSLRQ